MKKILLFLCLCIAFISSTKAQTITFTVNQAPCNNNGIVTATVPSTSILPVTINYMIGVTTITHTITSGYTDVLNNYSGSLMYVYAVDAMQNTSYGNFSASPFTVTNTMVPGVCPAPTVITASVAGGASPYSFLWTDYSTGAVYGTSNPLSTILSNVGINLLVTDNNGCTVLVDSSIYVYSNPAFSFIINYTNAACTNGTALLGTMSGASTPPYSYLWNTGATTTSIAGLSQGSYNLKITDANGCSATGYAFINQVPYITVNTSPTPATCVQNNGSAIAFGSGGTPPYSYTWSNGSTTNTITNMNSGYYTVNVVDVNGCTGNSGAFINSSTPIFVTYATTPSSCTAPTGSATLTINGGTAPYTTTWNTWPASTGVTVSNLAPGTYSFSVVDAVGCVQNGTVSIPPVNIINLNVVPTNPTCTSSNGSIVVTATGGASPYTYLWNNAATTASVSGLAAGGYSVTVTDAVGCSKTSAPYLNAVSPVSVGFATTPTNCLYAQTGAVASNVLGGTLPYTYNWSSGSSATSISGLGEGYYHLSVTDAVGCTAQGTAYVSNNNTSTACYCTITGTVYYDVNNNCVKDAAEVGIPNIQMHLVGFGYAYTDANGVYTFLAPSGTYTLTENINSYYPLSTCQSNSIVINSAAAAGCVITNDFSNSMLTIHDLKINLWRNWISTPPVPGNSYSQLMVIENNGTVTESSITTSYKTDGQLNGATISPASFTANATNANFYEAAAVPTINAGTIQTYAINYATPTNIPINTQLQFNDTCANTTPMSNWLNDYSPWDNVNAYTDIVVSSYDPNFKEVAPKGKGTPGWITRNDSVLSYAVHFQNLGTYFAQNIVVLDTLDSDLNWSTLKPSYHSHNCEVTISEIGVAKWTFKNINLPAKVQNEAFSNGMFTYSIHTKPGLAYGTQFTNSASIYFDYNEPVRTNKTINTIDSSAFNAIEKVGLANNNSIHITPNPASSQTSISFNNSDQSKLTSLSILDATGRVVYLKAIPSATTAITQTINTSELQSGFYFVILKDVMGKTYNQKLVIVK